MENREYSSPRREENRGTLRRVLHPPYTHPGIPTLVYIPSSLLPPGYTLPPAVHAASYDATPSAKEGEPGLRKRKEPGLGGKEKPLRRVSSVLLVPLRIVLSDLPCEKTERSDRHRVTLLK